MRNHNQTQQRECPVCPRADREWIEMLMASGAYYDDLRLEFGIRVIDLRRHEALHSTKQPSADPLTLLRHIRWLNEQAEKLVRREVNSNSDKLIKRETYARRRQAIDTSLRVVSVYAELINAKKHLDAHVVLPRWHQVIMKLSEKLKHIPGATEALVEWAQEEGPTNTGVLVKTDEVQNLIEQERAQPHYAYHHRQHTCPKCERKFRCFDAHCTEPHQTCRKCLMAQPRIEIEEGIFMPETHEHECPKCRNTFNCDRVPCAGPPELCPTCAAAEAAGSGPESAVAGPESRVLGPELKRETRDSRPETPKEPEGDPAPEEPPREDPPEEQTADDGPPTEEPGGQQSAVSGQSDADTKKKTSEPQAAEEVSAQAQIAAEGTVR